MRHRRFKRTEKTVWRVTAADLDARAGRELTNDELDRVETAIPHSSIPEALDTILDGMGLITVKEDDS